MNQLKILVKELNEHIKFYKLIDYTYLYSSQCVIKVWYNTSKEDLELDERKYLVTFKNDRIEKVEDHDV
jgi:hypothetical protein